MWREIYPVQADVRLHPFLTSALDGSEFLRHASSTLRAGQITPVPVEQEPGWDPG